MFLFLLGSVEKMDAYEALKTVKEYICSKDSAVVCTGTELRSDDKVGLLFCERIEELAKEKEIALIKCPYGLENCLNELINVKPKKLLLIDACLPSQKIERPFVIADLNSVTANYLATTHNIPITITLGYLRMNNVAQEVKFLGIVAHNLEFGEELSEKVERALNELVEAFKEILKEC